MKKVIVFGIGDFAELVHYYLSSDPHYQIAAFSVHDQYLREDSFLGLPVIAFEELEKNYRPGDYEMFIAVGYRKINKMREEVYFEAKKRGYSLVTYVNQKASVFDNVEIGENCFIFEDNTVQPFSSIGNNSILWSGNHLGHHSKIEDHCFITSHVVIAGRSQVGRNTFIGVNATIGDHVKIGKENVIGAGSLVLKDTDDYAVFAPRTTEQSRVPSNRLKGI